MREYTESEQERGQRARGITRRQFGRMAALLTAGSTLPFYNESALAQDLKAMASFPSDAIRLNANENPMGPCPAAVEAIREMVPQGGRYLFNQTFAFAEAMAAAENLPSSHVIPSAGSSDPLHRSVLAFTSPTRSLIVADPGYEAPERAARFVGAKVIQVPLRKDYSHDVQAMIRADPNAGAIYICNPNNPTGTITRGDDIAYVVANKPKGCVVILDEAYIHFASSLASATDMVAANKDVVVLRTFSKLYGMAGLRAGAALGRPDLLERLRGFGGLSLMPATGMVGAIASLKDKTLVPERRRIMAEIRTDLFAWLDKKGFAFIPSEANMVMIDGKRPGREIAQRMMEQKVAIGRAWSALPNHVRVTIGTRDEMAKFKSAFERVMAS